MSSNIATIGARLSLDGTGFTQSLNTAGQQTQQFTGNLTQLGNQTTSTLAKLNAKFNSDLAKMTAKASSDLGKVGNKFSSQMKESVNSAGDAVSGSGNKWVEWAAKANLAGTAIELVKTGGGMILDQAKGALDQEVMIDSVARGLASVSDGAETISDQMKNIAEAAKMPGTGFQEIAQGSLKLQAVGVSAKDSRDALVEFGNALANVGSGKAELEGITDILTGMFGDQEVTSETIDSMAGLYPKIRAMLPTIDTSSPDAFLKGVVTELRTLPRASGNAKDAMDNLSDAYQAFRNKITQGKINTSMTEAINASANFMEAEGFGAKFNALKDGVTKTFKEATAPATGFEKYEISAEEIAKRKQKKEEDAAKVKEKALKAAQDLMQEQVDQLEMQREIARAIADGDMKRKDALEKQLAVQKEAKKMAEELKITEEQAAELVERRIDAEHRLRDADPNKAASRKKIQEEEEVARLRDKGKTRQADKLVEQRTVRDRMQQLRDTGFTEDEAKKISDEEAKRRDKERDLQRRGGRRRIRGAKSEPVKTGLDNPGKYVFEKGDQDGDEPIFVPTGMKWQPRLLRKPDGSSAADPPLFGNGSLPGQPEPPETRTIKGAGSKKKEEEKAATATKSDTPLADLILEAKKQTGLLQTIAGSGSVADKTKPQNSGN